MAIFSASGGARPQTEGRTGRGRTARTPHIKSLEPESRCIGMFRNLIDRFDG
jgi:hypothetical protein